MASTKQLPIGIDNFKTLIDNNYYFVDKTLMIRDVIHNIGIPFNHPRYSPTVDSHRLWENSFYGNLNGFCIRSICHEFLHLG